MNRDGAPPALSDADEHRDASAFGAPRWTRRRILACGIGGFIGAAFAGLELVEHGVLPGKQALDALDGACSVSGPTLTFGAAGQSTSGQFFSSERNRTVGYTIAYPPGHAPGSVLPLAVYLHGFGGSHRDGLGHVSLAQALAAKAHGVALPAMAMVAVDGGGLYWNPHPGDDPMAMVVNELIPMCQQLGLGRPPHRIGMIGISMGGYGALLLTERHPTLVSAAAAISPAVWTTYAQARSANAGAFASAEDFNNDDVITHAAALTDLPVWIASGTNDPFHSGVVALAQAVPKSTIVEITPGCHDGSFFSSQHHASLTFLAAHLTRA
jgi:pimeloyl-ACP methyl ester carboxylesterase